MPWFDIASTFGLPTLILAALGWAIYQGVKSLGAWIAPRADQIIETHLRFIEKTDGRLDNIETNIRDIKTVQATQTSILERMSAYQSNGQPRPDA